MITIDQKIAEFFNNEMVVNGWPLGNLLLCVIALVLCILLVGVIGIEREKRGRSAGLRTHLLVGIGSTMIMIISIYGFPAVFGGDRDVARLAAQVVTGVGFLGAGAIIHSKGGIKGLTTAGTIWASMAIGIACGSFNFVLAIVGTGIVVLILTIFKRVEVKLTKQNPTIIMNVKADQPVLGKVLEVVARHHGTVARVYTNKVDDSNPALIEILVKVNFYEKNQDVNALLSDLEQEIKPESIDILSHI